VDLTAVTSEVTQNERALARNLLGVRVDEAPRRSENQPTVVSLSCVPV